MKVPDDNDEWWKTKEEEEKEINGGKLKFYFGYKICLVWSRVICFCKTDLLHISSPNKKKKIQIRYFYLPGRLPSFPLLFFQCLSKQKVCFGKMKANVFSCELGSEKLSTG